jgi:hypothetical protein
MAEPSSGWESNVVFDRHMGKAKPEPVTIPGHTEIPPVSQDDDQKYHTDNWFQSMRSRKLPNADIHSGFAHAVAVVMATRSYREGKKLHWDRKNEQILES